MTEQVEVKMGQQWRERDSRTTRVVEVVQIAPDGPRRVKIRTVESDNPNAIGRSTWADHSRFSGKYGGYELVVDTKADSDDARAV
ncbi:hypothetical protein [Burkholderia vietnamiensis]|uniref:hypothetical protein n=1 Tax=Burkholderia vietnamiensis TaxID=60552 RepID=UPI001CF5A228|nr:hypothetical protein [Burkholderia vietnamiensis]MCA8198491.1 hypothetical protein [Burkholderia vietnamiensis]